MIGAKNRDVSWRKALRKRRIANQVYWSSRERGWEYYDNLHQYSKNKIHCSCPYCSTKTRNKGKRIKKNYGPNINYKASDKRKIDAMVFGEMEANEIMTNIKVIVDDGVVISVLQDTDEPILVEVVDCNEDYGSETTDYVKAIYKNPKFKNRDYTMTHVDTGDSYDAERDS